MIPLEEDEKGIYILNSKDLCLIDYLDKLIAVGVKSFKIEGRTKSQYYVSVATRAYRLMLDNLKSSKIKKEAREELLKIDNRGYTTGFLFGDEGVKRQEFQTSKQKSDWQFVGETVNQKGGTIFFKPHNMLRAGEDLELLTPHKCYKIKVKEFYGPNDEILQEVHGGTDKIYSFKSNLKNISVGLIRKKI
jgi:putative protease